MPRSKLDQRLSAPLSTSRYLIMLSLKHSPKHGYAIIKDVMDLTDARVKITIPSLYENLKRLLDDGLIERAGDRTIADGERRKVYRLSGLGRRVLSAEDELRNAIERSRRRRLAPGGAV